MTMRHTLTDRYGRKFYVHHNVKCAHPACRFKPLDAITYDPVYRCEKHGGKMVPSAGSMTLGTPETGHWKDDPSGASSSWDNAVKRYEEQYDG